MKDNLNCIMVIFGGTGDLTHRKLMPALYNLDNGNNLPENFAVVSVGRRDKTSEQYREEVYNSIKKFSRYKPEEKKWISLRNRIYYQKFDFTEDTGYTELKNSLDNLDNKYNTKGNRIFYLAVAPEFFDVIVGKLSHNGLVNNTKSWQRAVIEKPFGRDLNSARYLNKKITEVFTEKNIYRIDHYLGKEMMQNIMAIRFANVVFEPVWNSTYVDNIQITSSEKVGVEKRGGYYERAGALRDMMQNHMLQLLTLATMEPPVSLEAESIRDEKVKVLRSLQQFSSKTVKGTVIRGQYGSGVIDGNKVIGYKEEQRVSDTSNTETFMALKAHIENFRWGGTPIYIRTGKRLPVKTTEIIIQFKQLPDILYHKTIGNLESNLLVIRIQPSEGVFFKFNAKKPGTKETIIPVSMDFCQNAPNESNSPEAYERLISDIMRGDSTLFTRWDEVEYSWKFVDSIMKEWNGDKPNFPNYKAGTWGPKEADRLLTKDGRKWINLDKLTSCK